MEHATTWGLIFRQDPSRFWDGTEYDVAQRWASLPVADRLLKEVRRG